MSFGRDVQREVKDHFKQLGFRTKRGVLSKPLNPEGSASLGFGVANYRTIASIFPTVAVDFESVRQHGVALGLVPEKASASLFVPLKYLVPEEDRTDYDFSPKADNQPTFDRLVSDVKEYGYPFFESLSTIERARATIRIKLYPELNGAQWFLPLSYIVQGDFPEALRLTREMLPSINTERGDGPRWLVFLANLESIVAADSGGRQEPDSI